MKQKSGIIKIKLNSAGVSQILNGTEIRDNLSGRATRIANSLPTNDGEKWEPSIFKGSDRTNATVRTANTAAKRTSAEENALLLGLSAGK